jgi:hypothetical protein
LVKFQPTVLVPVPPVFWKVPALEGGRLESWWEIG